VTLAKSTLLWNDLPMFATKAQGVTPKRGHAVGLPITLTHRQLRVFTTRDAKAAYASPRPQLKRLADAGLLRRLHGGIFAIVPTEHIGRPWTPPLEAAAVGLEAARSGLEGAVLMGMSAARLHGAVPRGLGRATVATRVQRRPITLDGTRLEIRFVKRPVDDLDADLITTVLGDVLVTSIEQTILDLAHPHVQEPPAEAEREAIQSLAPRADHAVLRELAVRQRLGRALLRAQQVSPALLEDTETLVMLIRLTPLELRCGSTGLPSHDHRVPAPLSR
jgi:AbiEi antitoxin C-terminal domain/Transcriptional regulator, AbiEi antitoxin